MVILFAQKAGAACCKRDKHLKSCSEGDKPKGKNKEKNLQRRNSASGRSANRYWPL